MMAQLRFYEAALTLVSSEVTIGIGWP